LPPLFLPIPVSHLGQKPAACPPPVSASSFSPPSLDLDEDGRLSCSLTFPSLPLLAPQLFVPPLFPSLLSFLSLLLFTLSITQGWHHPPSLDAEERTSFMNDPHAPRARAPPGLRIPPPLSFPLHNSFFWDILPQSSFCPPWFYSSF